MAISYRGASNAAGQASGTTTTASTVSITPTLPTGAAAGDRIFVIQCGSNTSGTTPTDWNVLGTKDTTVGSGAVAAASGARRMTVYYRDYNGAWSMPAFTLTSAAQNSHWIGAVAITPTAGSAFDVPTITTVGGAFNAATTSYTDSSAASFTTHSGGFLIVGTCLNDNVTGASPALSQTGATFASLTERCDGGTATGNDVAGQVHTASVTTGAAATTTFTETLSAASQGETLIVEQTEYVWGGPRFASQGTEGTGNSGAGTSSIPIPAGVTQDDIILANLYVEGSSAVTPPTGFTEAADSPVIVTGTGAHYLHVYWKRQTSATGAGETTGNYDFVVATGNTWRQGTAWRFTNCVTSGDPYDVTNSNSATQNSSTNLPAVSDTTTVNDTLLVWVCSTFDGTTKLPPTGFTYRKQVNNVFADKPQAAAGATGSLVGTTNAVNTARCVWLGALKPPTTAQTVTPSAASLTVTGAAPRLDLTLFPSGASLTVTGSAPRLDFGIRPAAAALTVTGSAPRLDSGIRPAAASLTVTGSAPTIVTPQTFTPGGASLTLSGSAPTVTIGVNVTPGAASLTLTGSAPVVATPQTFTPTGASLTLTGAAPRLDTGLQPASATLALSGAAPRLDTGLRPAGASLTVTGSAPRLDWGIRPAGASLTVTGAAPTVTATANQVIQPAAATLTLTGALPDVQAGGSLSPSPDDAELTLSGSAPTVSTTAHQTVTPSGAALTLTGSAPTVTASAHQTVTPSGAALSATGSTPLVLTPIYVIPDPATLTVSGAAPRLEHVLHPDPGTLTLSGSTPLVLLPYTVQPNAAELTLTGQTPTITWLTAGPPPESRTSIVRSDSRISVVVAEPRGSVVVSEPRTSTVVAPLRVSDVSGDTRLSTVS